MNCVFHFASEPSAAKSRLFDLGDVLGTPDGRMDAPAAQLHSRFGFLFLCPLPFLDDEGHD